jgi:hypothetical protein
MRDFSRISASILYPSADCCLALAKPPRRESNLRAVSLVRVPSGRRVSFIGRRSLRRAIAPESSMSGRAILNNAEFERETFTACDRDRALLSFIPNKPRHTAALALLALREERF